MNRVGFLRFYTSTAFLILANVVTIVFALVQKWNIGDVIWIYCAQSIIIGLFHFLYILDLREFSTKGFRFHSMLQHSPQGLKRTAAWFFLFHYGLLHLIFFVCMKYLWELTPSMSSLYLALCILAFLGTHGFSYWENRRKVADVKPNISLLMFTPYARIVPMWLTLTIGIYYAGGSLRTLVMFLILKTVADVVMHIVEHRNDDRPLAGQTGSF